MVEEVDRVLKYLSEVEETAEDILADKGSIVNLDRRRNMIRQGTRNIINELKTKGPGGGQGGKKQWFCMGNMFLKMETKTAKDLFEKDLKTLDTEIDNIRKGLKQKVAKLRELEGQPELRGYDLHPLSQQELAAVGGNNN